MKSVLIIAGPTGSGKSELAIKLADQLNGEIINADSVAIYKYFDIGTAKPTLQQQQGIPHHLFDILEPQDELDAARYSQMCLKVIDEIKCRKKLSIVVGGSGLYLRALIGQNFHDLPHDETLRRQISELPSEHLHAKLSECDPVRSTEIHPHDHFRLARAIEIFSLTGKTMSELKAIAPKKEALAATMIILEPERKVLHERIANRTTSMIQQGLVTEVEELLRKGISESCKPFQSIGYKQVLSHLSGEFQIAELHQRILFATRQYAKSQVTWFKKMDADIRLNSSNFDNLDLDSLISLLSI